MQGASDTLAKGAFLLSAAFAVFVYGIAADHYHFFPYAWVEAAAREVRAQVGRSNHHLFPLRYPAAGAHTHLADHVAPGLTLLTSYWRDSGWRTGIRLIDPNGRVLHRWDVDAAKLWPDAEHTDGSYVHGSHLFENGDVLFNVEYLGLVRMNACGEVLWQLPIHTHHSIHRDEAGDFWIPALRWVQDTPEGRERSKLFPGLVLPFVEDYAIKVSEQGKVLKEISLLEALVRSGNEYLIWKSGASRTEDVTHLNDVEPLSSAMAPRFPSFRAGDLLISMKSIDAVFVLDPEDGRVKWLTTRPFMEQHDPDFLPDGWIAVFDNRADDTPTGANLGGSRIVAVKPGSDEERVLYPGPASTQGFYSEFGGKLQQLSNGNLLITEAGAGRVFETDGDGRVVWEWIHEPYDETRVAEVLEGTRYEWTAAQVAAWPCAERSALTAVP